MIIDEKHLLEETLMVWIWYMFSYKLDDNASRESHVGDVAWLSYLYGVLIHRLYNEYTNSASKNVIYF